MSYELVAPWLRQDSDRIDASTTEAARTDTIRPVEPPGTLPPLLVDCQPIPRPVSGATPGGGFQTLGPPFEVTTTISEAYSRYYGVSDPFGDGFPFTFPVTFQFVGLLSTAGGIQLVRRTPRLDSQQVPDSDLLLVVKSGERWEGRYLIYRQSNPRFGVIRYGMIYYLETGSIRLYVEYDLLGCDPAAFHTSEGLQTAFFPFDEIPPNQDFFLDRRGLPDPLFRFPRSRVVEL